MNIDYFQADSTWTVDLPNTKQECTHSTTTFHVAVNEMFRKHKELRLAKITLSWAKPTYVRDPLLRWIFVLTNLRDRFTFKKQTRFSVPAMPNYLPRHIVFKCLSWWENSQIICRDWLDSLRPCWESQRCVWGTCCALHVRLRPWRKLRVYQKGRQYFQHEYCTILILRLKWMWTAVKCAYASVICVGFEPAKAPRTTVVPAVGVKEVLINAPCQHYETYPLQPVSRFQ
jgi:hypothetical protein